MVDTSGTWTIITTSAWNSAQSQFQIYQIAAILMVFVIIGIIVLFKDAIPFIWARFVTHDVVVGVLDKITRKITLNADFKKKDEMLYYLGEPLPFVKMYKGNFMFAGWPFDICDVDLKVIIDPRYKKACEELRKAGYPNIGALEKALMFSQMKETDHRVLDIIKREGYDNYEQAKKAINPGGLTTEHEIVKQFFTAIPLAEMLGYGTEVPSEDILGEVDDVYEARKPSMQMKRQIEKIIPICAAVFVVAVIGVIAYVVFFKAKTG